MWTVNFQMFKLVLEKAEEPEIKLLSGSWLEAGGLRKLLLFCWHGTSVAGAASSLLFPTLWQMLWNSQEVKINMGREDGERRQCQVPSASFSIWTNTWSVLPPGLLLCGGQVTSYSLILIQELTITCSHYHCTWYKILPLAAGATSLLEIANSFPHITFFEN